MRTAQFHNHKKIVLTTGLLAAVGVLLSFSSGVLAQSMSNPFVPPAGQSQNTLEVEPLLLTSPDASGDTAHTPGATDPTDATRTIAQDQIALTAIPPRLGEDGSLTAAPGEKLQIQLRVRNISEQAVSVITSAQDFILAPDGATPISIDDSVSNRWSLASWLTITPTEHRIPAKDTIGITVLIEVPEDALPGGHYAMVLHEPGSGTQNNAFSVDPTTNESGAAINQRVGTLLYVIVDGPINEEAYIRDFSFPRFSEYGPVPFDFFVENNSDVHITPQMSVEIFNIFNQKIETIAIEPKNIFPLTSRDFDGQWDRVWGWGLYKAKLTMSYGSSGAIVVANSSFWLIPITVIIAACILLLSVILIGFAIKRHLNHRKKMDEQRIRELESKIEEMQSHEE